MSKAGKRLKQEFTSLSEAMLTGGTAYGDPNSKKVEDAIKRRREDRKRDEEE